MTENRVAQDLPSRAESQAQTRAALLHAARDCFLERGFHAASVSQIAGRAGYTTGALYSNFGGKDDLFLAMLDEHLADRARSQQLEMGEGATFEATVRAAARDLHRAGEREPGMTPLTVEFWTYAASRPHLRERARELHERQLGWVADLIRIACERHGVRLKLSPAEVARGGGALSRGIRLERLLDPTGVAEDTFVEMFTSYLIGLEEQP